MPQNNLPINHQPQSIEWDYDDEIHIARGYIPGYGTFVCHGACIEQCLQEYEDFAESIRQEIIEYGQIDDPRNWEPNYTNNPDIPTPPDDHFGFDYNIDVEYF